MLDHFLKWVVSHIMAVSHVRFTWCDLCGFWLHGIPSFQVVSELRCLGIFAVSVGYVVFEKYFKIFKMICFLLFPPHVVIHA